MVKYLKPQQITVEDSVQQRVNGVDKEYVAELAAHLTENKKAHLPAVVVFAQNKMRGPWLLAGGHHTLAAYLLAERPQIPVDVRSGGLLEAITYALSDNAVHGKRRTHEDCVKAVMTARSLPEYKDLSDSDIDRLCGVFVGFTARLARRRGDREADPIKSRAGREGNKKRHGDKAQPKSESVPFDSTSEKTADAPRDCLGRVLPAQLVEVFVPGEPQQAYQAARQAMNKAKKLKEKAAVTALQLAVSSLQRKLPYCVCPACDASGGSCPTCGGAGYLTYGQYEHLPEALKEQAKSHKPGDAWEGELPEIPGAVPAFAADPGCDTKGQKIPPRLRDLFSDRYLQDASILLQTLAAGVQSCTSWNPWLSTLIGEELNASAAKIQGAIPHTVCSCKGKGCGACQVSGFLPFSARHES